MKKARIRPGFLFFKDLSQFPRSQSEFFNNSIVRQFQTKYHNYAIAGQQLTIHFCRIIKKQSK